MKSKAAIGNHPLHPAMVVLPIGAWFVTLVGDICYFATAEPFWYQVSYYTMLIGVVTALVAAILGFIDFFGVRMSEAGYKVAKTHMTLNLIIVALYGVSLWLRHDNMAMAGGRWTAAFATQIVPFLMLLGSGWLGGKLAYEHKVGVVENYDAEATEIGRQEPGHAEPATTRTRGLQG